MAQSAEVEVDGKVLRKWLKKQDVFHSDLEKILLDKGITDPEEDFKAMSEKQWNNLRNEAIVFRAKDLKSQQAKVRWEATLKKIEKFWRKQSGIKSTSIKNQKTASNITHNTADNEQSLKYEQALELKKYMQQNSIWNTDLFECLVFEYDIKSEDDICIKINSRKTLDEIINNLRVARNKDIKESKARRRLDKTLNKFERIVIHKNNQLKKTSIKSDDDEKQLKEWESDKMKKDRDDEGKDIKQWLQKENIWLVELYDGLILNGVTSPFMIQCLEEVEFDEIVRTVRVERFSNVKDNSARQNIDKMLVKFEKIWRKESGTKKTSIKKT